MNDTSVSAAEYYGEASKGDVVRVRSEHGHVNVRVHSAVLTPGHVILSGNDRSNGYRLRHDDRIVVLEKVG